MAVKRCYIKVCFKVRMELAARSKLITSHGTGVASTIALFYDLDSIAWLMIFKKKKNSFSLLFFFFFPLNAHLVTCMNNQGLVFCYQG